MTRAARLPVETILPVGLAIAGWLALLMAVGGAGAPLLLGWLAGTALMAFAAAGLHGGRRRVAGLMLAVAFLVLAWVGGLFFVPSALALVAFAPQT